MCTNQAFQRYSITRRTMSIANIVGLKSLVLLLTISCGNQKTSNDSASATLLSSTDSRNLCENLRAEGIEVSSCDSLKASSAQAPTRYLADVVNTMSQLKLDKAATIRQPIILESMSGAKSPTIRISAVTDRSTFRGLVILGYGSNSNEISPSSNVQAMVAGNLAKDLQASTVLILTVIESEADQQIIFNGSSRIDPTNLQLFEDFKNQSIASSFKQVGLRPRPASPAPASKQSGAVIFMDDTDPVGSSTFNPRIILTKKSKCDPTIVAKVESNDPNKFIVEFCPASDAEKDLSAALKGNFLAQSKSIGPAKVALSSFRLDSPSTTQPPAIASNSADSPSQTPSPTNSLESWLSAAGVPGTCVRSTCYYKIASLGFETGGPIGLINKYEISTSALPGFTIVPSGPKAVSTSCTYGCYLEPLTTKDGKSYFKKHPVFETESSVFDPTCINERCYVADTPSALCPKKIFEYFPGKDVTLRQKKAFVETKCAYTESPQLVTKEQCFEPDPISLGIRGAGKVNRGNGVELCSHAAVNLKECGEIPIANLVATPAANWVFTHWDFEGLTLKGHNSTNDYSSVPPNEPKVLPSLLPDSIKTTLTANFQFKPAAMIRVYTKVMNDDEWNPLPDLNFLEAGGKFFVGPGDNPATGSEKCDARGAAFCSVYPSKIPSMTAKPSSPYYYFDGWWVVDLDTKNNYANYGLPKLLSAAPTLQKNLIPKTGDLTAIFKPKPAPTQVTVVLEGAGYGSVLVAAPAYFSPSNGTDCKKSAAMSGGSVSCTAELQFREGIFTAQPDAGSYFLRWIFENTEGRDMTNLEKACPPTVATCNLSKAVIPSGTSLIARFGRPTVLNVELVKGGSVENEGTGSVGSKSWQPPKFWPGSAAKCGISMPGKCTIVVTDQNGQKNRIFSAPGYVPKASFTGFQLLNEKGQEQYVAGCWGYRCDLRNIQIGYGWTLKATWRRILPAGTITIKISGPTGQIPGTPRVSLPSAFMDGGAWPVNSYNTDGERRVSVYNSRTNLYEPRTNFTHLREQILNIPEDGILSLGYISADPVGGCGRLGISEWIVTRRISSRNGQPIGPDISGDCATGGSCDLSKLANVASGDEYPESIEAVFKMGDPCTSTSTVSSPPTGGGGGGGGSGATTAPVTTAPATTAPVTTPPATTAPVTTAPESGGCSWSPVAPGANGCQPGYSVFACANVNGGLPICMQNSCGCGFIR